LQLTRKESKVEKVWKVTEDGYSVIAKIDGWVLKYEKDVVTVPRYEGSLLFAFDTLEAAEHFLKVYIWNQHLPNMQIWECETDWIVYPDYAAYIGEWHYFWKEIRRHGLQFFLQNGKVVGDKDARAAFHPTMAYPGTSGMNSTGIDLSYIPPGTVMCPNLTPRVRIK